MTQPYTPAQLEAWAGLGPWEWSEETICRQVYHFLGPGVLVTTETDGTPWGDTIDKTNAALIAAAPDLARLVLEREKEIAELKAAALDLVSLCSADVKMNGTTYQPMPNRSAFTKAVEHLLEAINSARQAMKETSDE